MSAHRTVAGPMPRGSDLRAAITAARAQSALVGVLLLLAGLAWWSTDASMAGMDAGPGTALGGLLWFTGVWIVMMAAMMLPSVAPTVALYGQMTRRRDPMRPLAFAAGYLLVWGLAGVAAFGAFQLGADLFSSGLAWRSGGRWFAGGVLALAAAYELTPLKDVCLSRCRGPVGFLVGAWREGRRGALEMGALHGAWCLGCCWALMAALFALGVMGIGWMALVAGLITVEKLLPWRRVATYGTAALLMALAIVLVSSPESIPGLVVPDSGHSMGAMKGMG